MLAGHSHKLLAEAARESIERIQLDRRKAPQRLKPLLSYIEENLFDPKLDVNHLKRKCGVRDNSVPIQFHSAVGRPPHGYIEDRRLETACRLLAESHLKIWQISELLGYSSIQVFSRAFSRWSGQRPTLFRRKARRGDAADHEDDRESGRRGRRFDRSVTATDSLRTALDGELPADEANTLIGRLLALYPGSYETLGGSEPAVDQDSAQGAAAASEAGESRPDAESTQFRGNARDRYMAESIWSSLAGQRPERQAEILGQTTVTSTALFELLIEKSREIGRSEPERGVGTAELALASLDALVRRPADDKAFAGLQAQGLTRLANSRNLNGDLHAAELGFDEAERLLEAAGRPPAIEAEVLTHKASLRRDQQRFAEARELLERARAACPDGDSDLLAQILMIQGSVGLEEGNPEVAIPYLEQALPLAERSKDLLLREAIVALQTQAGDQTIERHDSDTAAVSVA